MVYINTNKCTIIISNIRILRLRKQEELFI